MLPQSAFTLDFFLSDPTSGGARLKLFIEVIVGLINQFKIGAKYID